MNKQKKTQPKITVKGVEKKKRKCYFYYSGVFKCSFQTLDQGFLT